MTLTKLKKAILEWANRKGEEAYAEDAAKHCKVSRELSKKAFEALHKTKELVCLDGCDKCDS
jgi:response regulator of citrate/malate metabolism